ncbi:CPBP family intramembrane glutamic endopeptidase [Flavobacterium sp.]|uniref:CPBP family intramembrane glutamic endopeptidase n=1 Tax=Flavobacterium sp. TaxID=239 RepID=UPI002B4AE7F0|nr:CPBP family intramembrane glutamic endopeptidase [Flavobacterium sp.]HLP63209.1 CPBP family intramembrane glutamic endopeptidase [Flavobacterium sp.]
MKNSFITKSLKLIFIFLVIIVSTREILPLIFQKNYNEFKFLYQLIVKVLLIFSTIYFIKKESFFNLKYVFKNNILSFLLCSLFLYFSIKNTLSSIKELNLEISNFKHFTYLFQCLSTGFFEECFFRILIFGYVCMIFKEKQTQNYYQQVILTSALFSIVHLTNIFNKEVDPYSVLNQMIFAFIFGVLLQSIFYRINNIVLNSVIHGLINYNGMVKSKLFNIVDTSSNTSVLDDFIQSLLTAIILGILIVAPITYFALKNKKNNLIIEDVNVNNS